MASTSTLCPYCHRHSNTTLVWGRVYDDATKVRFAATCDYCERLLTAEGWGSNLGNSPDSTDINRVRHAQHQAQAFTWKPTAAEAPEIEDVPDPIARAAKEAYSSASIGNHMAAVLMARTIVEATAKAKGIEVRGLDKKINTMRDENLIRPDIAELAHEVRFAGNDMAHGDIDVPIDETDSEEVLALMAEVLSEVFQGPARVARVKAKRLGTAGGSDPGRSLIDPPGPPSTT